MAADPIFFDAFMYDSMAGIHDFATHEFHIMLTNTAPDSVNDAVYADITEITPEHGYSATGETVTVALSVSTPNGVVTASANVVFGATGGSFGPFQYAVMLNYTATEQNLVCYWEYEGGSISLLDTETLTMAFNANQIFTVAQA